VRVEWTNHETQQTESKQNYWQSINGIPRLTIAKCTITKNRFVSVRSHETPRTESDKHYDQIKANVWAGAAVVNLKAKILVSSSVYHSRNKRNGGHQTLPLGWVQNRLKISRIMAGIAKRVGEFRAESIQCKKGLTIAYTTSTVLCSVTRPFLSLHSCLRRALGVVL